MENIHWSIQQLKREANTGLVFEVRYKVYTGQSGVLAIHEDKITLQGDINSPDFIPFNDLTQSQVLEWIKNAVDVNEIETNLLTELTDKISSIQSKNSANGLPWNTNILKITS